MTANSPAAEQRADKSLFKVSLFLSIRILYVCPRVCLSICLSVRPLVFPFVRLCLPFSLSASPAAGLPPSLCPSLQTSIGSAVRRSGSSSSFVHTCPSAPHSLGLSDNLPFSSIFSSISLPLLRSSFSPSTSSLTLDFYFKGLFERR